MPDRSPEELVIRRDFDAGMVWVRHAAETVTNEKDAEEFFRQLNKMCRLLVPKFRKGNQLSRMLHDNLLANAPQRGVQSATEG